MSSNPNGKIMVFDSIVDKRMRLVLKYQYAFHPIFWFQVKSDGSIYLGPRYNNINLMKKGAKRMPPDTNSLTFTYDEGELVSDPALLKTSKTSFHASGIIHGGGDKILGTSLRTLTEPLQLCMVLFTHPSKYGIVPKPKKNDIVITDPIIEQNPLIAEICVTPMDKSMYRMHPSAANQMALVFELAGLKGMQDLLFQILLIQPEAGKWPPYSYIIFATPAPA